MHRDVRIHELILRMPNLVASKKVMMVTNKKSSCFIRVENPPSRTMVAQASASFPKPLIALSMNAHRSTMTWLNLASGSRRSPGTLVVVPAATLSMASPVLFPAYGLGAGQVL
jgi:hypothetical protein